MMPPPGGVWTAFCEVQKLCTALGCLSVAAHTTELQTNV